MKSLLEKNAIEIYSTQNEVDNIANKYNNACHNTIKMKPVDVKSNIFILVKKLMMKVLNLT